MAGLTEQLRLFCLGLAYAAAAYRFRSLWAAVGLHWGWNFAGAALSQAWPTTLADAASGRLVSAAVHLLLFAVIAGWVHAAQPADNPSKV